MGDTVSRRSFLKKAVGVIIGITAASSAFAVVRYLLPKMSGAAENLFLDAAGKPVAAAEIAEGSSFVGQSSFGPTIIIRHSGKLMAYSDVCTHLGCLVKWFPAEEEFICPCHGGRYDIHGKNISGPPPSPLPVYNAAVNQNGDIVLTKA